MFSKRLARILCVILFALINIVLLSISAKHPHRYTIVDRVVMAGIVPFQEGVTRTMHFCGRMWHHYFYLVAVREECDRLKGMLANAQIEKSRYLESELASQRLRKLLEMKSEVPHRMLPAKVVGLDPSGWFKTVFINRGTGDGVSRGMAVIASGGIVGRIIGASGRYAKVLLIIDRSSAIDALVQRTRSRGVLEGETSESCRFKYVVRKANIKIEDTVISSGLDGLFPKGLRVGTISEISRPSSGLFQEVKVRPFVDFTRLEEVLVILE
ncbi:MAG: rod shape-determining protein MreC [Deltaproteobacteria bacterium]|nr:rod shape-determining protein MreC [Deltaproteobacteria bacterium]MBW1793340.1 rod shape-determining protein MreC [Deltaproteobacteria bacterium]